MMTPPRTSRRAAARLARPDMTNLERRLIDDDDGAAPASHYLPSLLIATDAGATTVAPPGRAARERGRPALCANVLDEFVRALLPRSTSRRGGPARGLHAPPGPNGLLRGRHVPPALLPPHRPLTYPACRFLLSPSAHKEFAVDSHTLILPAQRTRMLREARDALDQVMFIKHGEAQT